MMKTTLKRLMAATLTTISGGVHASLIINEIDYDQPGIDDAEYIELYNDDDHRLSLDRYTIELINGGNQSVYRIIDLTGFEVEAHDYFVICSNRDRVANCDFAFTRRNSWFQNGAPDGLALYSDTRTRLDALSYEGVISGLTEGNHPRIKDSNASVMSLSRLPDGEDSNDNLADFSGSCLTPGSANVAGNGDCSTPTVGAVPLPPSLWLFGSGLLGLTGIGRWRHRDNPG